MTLTARTWTGYSLKLLWLVLPLAALAFWYGPGRVHRLRDDAGSHIKSAEAAAAAERWELAAAAYGRALAALPGEEAALRDRLSLARAQAALRAGEIVGAQEELEGVLARLEAGPERDSPLARAVRSELASASYHAAWLMRLEGAAPEEWRPEAERARQEFRLLAERPGQDGSAEAARFQRNLEATIRLEQMDLSELLARPLPKNCPPCKNLSQRKRKQCQSRCQAKGGKQDDIRKEIKNSQGAGLNERTGTGS